MGDIFDNVAKFIQAGVKSVQGLTPWLALGAIVVFGLMFAFGGQQASQMAKTRGTQVIIGLIIIWGAAAVVNTLIDLGEAGGSVKKIKLGMLAFKNTIMTVKPVIQSIIPNFLL